MMNMTEDAANTKPRCHWCNLSNPLYVAYHDTEWGVPVHDDRKLFEMLILEGFPGGSFEEYILKLRKRGMKFVGTTIVYSFLQAIGIINSHEMGCWLYKGK